MGNLLTDWELSQSPFPSLPTRASQRRSKSLANPVAPRSFESLQPWPRFFKLAASTARALDNNVRRNTNPIHTIDSLDEAADEVGVRVPLEAHVFAQTNRLVLRLGSVFKYKQGGSGRSYSCTDCVILDSSQTQPTGTRKQLSTRVFGNGEVKGPWQFNLDGFSSFEDALQDEKKRESVFHVIQQLFGDMVLDETKYGFITNYNTTIFFRRVGLKGLEHSPVVRIADAPLEKFLFVLKAAELDRAAKLGLSRIWVKDTPPGGYMVRLPQATRLSRSSRGSKRPLRTIQVKASSKRTKRASQPLLNRIVEDMKGDSFYDEYELEKVPTYAMEDLGMSGIVIGLGRYGNILEGTIHGVLTALKCFDLRYERARQAVVKEQEAYRELRLLQGTHIPSLLAVGRIPHSNIIFLALTYEGQCDLAKALQGKRSKTIERKNLECLDAIHQFRVLHNDLKPSHVLVSKIGTPKFIDFESSIVNAGNEVLKEETIEMET